MSQISHEPDTPENLQDSAPEETGRATPPFDNSGLQEIPQPRTDDPPYRSWWAVEPGRKGARRNWNNDD